MLAVWDHRKAEVPVLALQEQGYEPAREAGRERGRVAIASCITLSGLSKRELRLLSRHDPTLPSA